MSVTFQESARNTPPYVHPAHTLPGTFLKRRVTVKTNKPVVSSRTGGRFSQGKRAEGKHQPASHHTHRASLLRYVYRRSVSFWPRDSGGKVVREYLIAYPIGTVFGFLAEVCPEAVCVCVCEEGTAAKYPGGVPW